MHWLLYALGGGLGHLTRSIALARSAARQNVRVTLLTNSPYASRLPIENELADEDQLIVIPSIANREQTAACVKDTLGNTNAQLLVVDTFPRGLGGELAELLPKLPMPKTLVHRDLNPTYVESFGLNEFAETYDLILAPGECGPLESERILATSPWLIRDSDELLERSPARRLLNVDDDQLPVALVSGSGRTDEIREMSELATWLAQQLAERVHVRFCSPPPSVCADLTTWPLLPLMRGVDVIIGAGGYNTVSEARSTRTPLLAIPRPRMYDRQHVRLESRERFNDRQELLDRVLSACEPTVQKAVPNYSNGTHSAVLGMLKISESSK